MSKDEMFPLLEEQRREILEHVASKKKDMIFRESSDLQLLKAIAYELIDINLKLDKYLKP